MFFNSRRFRRVNGGIEFVALRRTTGHQGIPLITLRRPTAAPTSNVIRIEKGSSFPTEWPATARAGTPKLPGRAALLNRSKESTYCGPSLSRLASALQIWYYRCTILPVIVPLETRTPISSFVFMVLGRITYYKGNAPPPPKRPASGRLAGMSHRRPQPEIPQTDSLGKFGDMNSHHTGSHFGTDSE